MTYPEALAYLYARLPMFHRIGKAAYKADLRNTLALMDALGHPERGLRCVHVAGTNGKGSTSHMIASVLQEAGFRTGLYTSPHLKDFRERIKINGSMIEEAVVTRFVREHRRRFEAIAPSFFEWTVALAFHWFRSERVDIAVIETGLGGRLDSTNVITPEVSVITNIGWDHADLLGDTLEMIAVEKAGIIKPGVPVVVGEADGAVAEVFRSRATSENAPLVQVDHAGEFPFPLDLHGEHQKRNARTATAALRHLGPAWGITDQHIARGLAHVVANTGLRGRWEVLGTDPLVVVDVAHNEDGLRTVGSQLARTPHERLHIVLGTVNDKEIGRMLARLPPGAAYYFCKADIPRGLETSELLQRATTAGLKGYAFPSVKEAFEAAIAGAGPRDLVLVTGSVFVVAEVL